MAEPKSDNIVTRVAALGAGAHPYVGLSRTYVPRQLVADAAVYLDRLVILASIDPTPANPLERLAFAVLQETVSP